MIAVVICLLIAINVNGQTCPSDAISTLAVGDTSLSIPLTSPACFSCAYIAGGALRYYDDVTWTRRRSGANTLLTNGTGGVLIVPSTDTPDPTNTLVLNDPSVVIAVGDELRCDSSQARAAGHATGDHFITITAFRFLNPLISPINGTINIVEGSDLTLNCDDPGNTGGTSYQWFSVTGTELSNRETTPPAVLTFNNIMRTSSGVYICRSSKTNIGIKESNVTINVQYNDSMISSSSGSALISTVSSAVISTVSSAVISTVSSAVISTPAVSSAVISTPVVSSAVISTPAVSSAVISTPAVSSAVISTPAVSSTVIFTPAAGSSTVICMPACSRIVISTPAVSSAVIFTPAGSSTVISTSTVTSTVISTSTVTSTVISTSAICSAVISTSEVTSTVISTSTVTSTVISTFFISGVISTSVLTVTVTTNDTSLADNSCDIPVTISVVTSVIITSLLTIVICFGLVGIYMMCILWKRNKKRTGYAAADEDIQLTKVSPNIAYGQIQAATTTVTDEEVYYNHYIHD